MEWISEYKNCYNYNKIIQYKNNDKGSLFSFINSENISYFLKDKKNLQPDIIEGTDIITDFCLINKKLFKSIIEDINKSNKIYLKSDYNFQVLFGDNKIFLKDNVNWETFYYIYSINLSNNNYKLEYILNSKIKYLESFLSDYETFDELIKNYNIDLSLDEEQKTKDFSIKVIKESKNDKNNNKNKHSKHCLGLENVGATCYMNPTIQCLCYKC